MRALGYRPDPPSLDDHDALKVIKTVSPPVEVAKSVYTKTLDQGGLGSCTTNAAAQAVRVSEVQQLVAAGMSLIKAQATTEFFARLFAYYLARAISHETAQDSGTFIRFVFQVLNTFGFPPESVWAYDDDSSSSGKFTKMPSSAAFRRAFDQRLAADNGGTKVVDYSRISSTSYERVNDCKRAIADGHLVVFGTDVSNDFCSDMSANNGNPISPPINKAIAGGHAMVMGGYDKDDNFDVLNSWGDGYGQGGWCKFSADYTAWTRTTDLWIVKRAPMIAQETT